MNVFAIFAIAIALSVDAFAVAFSSGLQSKKITVSQTLKIGITFGGFQFLMPLIGWGLGKSAHQFIERFDHWIAFLLLAFIGGKMIWEAIKNQDQEDDAIDHATALSTLLLLGVATSLDALAVGLSFAMVEMSALIPSIMIGVVCFFISAIGLHLGRFVTHLPGLQTLGDKANIIGGIVLILIGINILREHGALSFV